MKKIIDFLEIPQMNHNLSSGRISHGVLSASTDVIVPLKSHTITRKADLVYPTKRR